MTIPKEEMSGSFKPGQLVAPISWCTVPIDLCSESNPRSSIKSRVIGRLMPGGVALIIALGRSDGSSVYLWGSNGGGWAESAFLRVVG